MKTIVIITLFVLTLKAEIIKHILAIESVQFVSLFCVLPDCDQYRAVWVRPDYSDFRFEVTTDNNGVLVDYIGHPAIGALFYGYYRSANCSRGLSVMMGLVHNATWELKEYPYVHHFAVGDFLTTASGTLLAFGFDVIADRCKCKYARFVLRISVYTGKCFSIVMEF